MKKSQYHYQDRDTNQAVMRYQLRHSRMAIFKVILKSVDEVVKILES